MVGGALGHYVITSLVGKGGMGEVYRAHDSRLDRDVALKVLPAAMASDRAWRERFEREARTLAGVSHPSIVTLHSVEEDAGVHFLVMELVEGQRLDAMIPPGGLPLARVFDIGTTLADALAAAHAKGVIHRDLKPANVMITVDGRVKVLDFGLAKRVGTMAAPTEDADTLPTLTEEGMVMGTVPYMSPEQLRGREIDARGDIFSLGIVLYEMTVGERPFGGASNLDVASAILRDTPPSVTQLRPELPRQLGRIISLCLSKEPSDRHQAALDVRNELRALQKEVESGITETGPAVSAERHSIAVLPFADMSPDRSQEYFADGISEELLNLLTRIPELRVTARTSSFSYKGKDVGIPEIARQLRVAHVLEGSVRKSGDRVRIGAQLVRAVGGFHVWSQTWDRKLDDIFTIQDEIAADVVKQLRISMLGDTPTTRKTDPEAYALYLRSIQLARQTVKDGFEKSDALLRRVLEIDPEYAPAWATLATNFGNKAVAGLMPPEEGFARAREANTEALRIDPQYAPAYAGLAFDAMYGEGDFAAAAQYLERATTLDPANPRALGNAATLLNLLGRCDEAVTLWEAITVRDAVNVSSLFNQGTSQLNAGRLDDAIASYRIVLSLSPGNGVAHYQIGVARLLGGDAHGALTEFDQEAVEVFRMIGLPMAYHALGRKAESDAALSRLVTAHRKDAAYNIAGVHAFRNEPDLAFEWLETERRNAGTFAEIVSDPLFASLHVDPRWVPFLREVGKAPEQLAEIPFVVAAPGEPDGRGDRGTAGTLPIARRTLSP